MVKRPKSPEAAEEDKYFTVYKPYPLNANWELEEDYIACSRWVASCIGTDPLHALYYKPSARGMILLEIDKKYPHNKRLLGEHRWSEFLKKPNEEEDGKVTQVFHSLYSKGRDAQKDGWKRIHVEATWFKDWAQFKEAIQDPYPDTYWCPTPSEDKTNKPLCRPLPAKDKGRPERPAPPVVGSANWVSSKTAPSLNTPQALKGAWERGRKSAPGAASLPSIPTGSAWNKPIIENNTSPTSPTNAWNNPIALVSPAAPSTAHPPGLGPRNPPAVNNQMPKQAYPSPPGLVPSGSSSSGSNSSGTNSERVFADKTFLDDFEDKITISLSPSQDRALYGTADDDVGGSPEITETGIIQPWEQDFVPQGVDDPTLGMWAQKNSVVAPVTNLWGEDGSAAAKKPVVAQCPFHKHECRKGVCQWRAKQVREEERMKQLTDKIDAGSRGGKGRGRGIPRSPGRGDDESQDGFSTVTRGGRGKGRGWGTASVRSGGSRAGSEWGN